MNHEHNGVSNLCIELLGFVSHELMFTCLVSKRYYCPIVTRGRAAASGYSSHSVGLFVCVYSPGCHSTAFTAWI